jgi:hypothetical protein
VLYSPWSNSCEPRGVQPPTALEGDLRPAPLVRGSTTSRSTLSIKMDDLEAELLRVWEVTVVSDPSYAVHLAVAAQSVHRAALALRIDSIM